jgi:transcriptional regulator with XRE-family HTH domain
MPKNVKDIDVIKEVAQRLQNLREEKKLTLKDVAFEADMEVTQVHRILHGTHDSQLTNIHKIAKALGTNLSDLLKGL